MKFRKSFTALLVAGALLATGAALAYQPAAAQDQQSSMSAPAPANASTTFNSPQGQVTVNSTMGNAPSVGTPPPFEQLSGGKKWITQDQAAAYPPLANDFDHANTSRTGHLTKAEYERWVNQLH
jgi:hypothetical protein